MAAQLSVQAPGGSRNGLRLETHTTLAGCWTARSFNMKQKLWMLAFVLALPSTRLDVFHGGRRQMRRWKPSGSSHLHKNKPSCCPTVFCAWVLGCFPCGHMEEPSYHQLQREAGMQQTLLQGCPCSLRDCLRYSYVCQESVSYTHLTLPTKTHQCRSRWSPYH